MKKLFLTLFLGISLSFASMVNGIAMKVNGSPITLYDIQNTMEHENISKEDAIEVLINKTLYEQLVKKYGITVNAYEVNDYIKKMVTRNGMSKNQFDEMIKREYPSADAFVNVTKERLIREKLITEIVRGNLAIANDEDMKFYYEKNKQQFVGTTVFKIVEYTSSSQQALMQLIKNPMIVPKGVNVVAKNLKVSTLGVEKFNFLNQIKNKAFTPIIPFNNMFMVAYIDDREKEGILPFSLVKDKVFGNVMREREAKYLKEYFEKQRLNADIQVLR